MVVLNRLGTDTQERVPTGFILCRCDSACPAEAWRRQMAKTLATAHNIQISQIKEN